MLIRASGPLTEDLHLLTLGASARYLLLPEQGPAALFDPGTSIHLDALLQRLARVGVTPQRLGYIFITHPHPDRAALAGHLKALNPSIQIIGSAQTNAALVNDWQGFERENDRLAALAGKGSSAVTSLPRFKVDRVVVEGEVVTIAPGYEVRVLAAPGHADGAFSYFIEAHRALIGDEVLGYFRGRELPAPGCDQSIEISTTTIKSLLDLDLAILALPYSGALTGELVQRHLQSLKQTIEDVVTESKRARAAGISLDEIRGQIARVLYTADQPDPLLENSMQQSFSRLWEQLAPTL